MPSPAVQLSFSLRTSDNVRSVHLLGSWDNYKSQLPLAEAKSGAKPGSWKGTFRFQGSHALKLGSRYWYYYMIDGYHVSHDPAKEYVVEKTTGRKLNVLNVPNGKHHQDPPKSASLHVHTRDLKEAPDKVALGRALSPTMIRHPRPSKPYASRGLREADYDVSPIDELEDRLANTRLSSMYKYHTPSPSELSSSSASSGTVFSPCGSASSRSSGSELECRCRRYGVTRDGRRVQLDCGGARCGYGGSSSSECASSSDESSEDDYHTRHKTTTRDPHRVHDSRQRPILVDRRQPVAHRRTH